MKKTILLLCAFAFLPAWLAAQMISGTVTNDEGTFLFGATVIWDGTSIGVIVDEDGSFSITKQDTIALLRIDYVGYESAYVEVLPDETELEISIEGITDLMAVEVAAERRDNYVSTLKTLNVETIGAGEFRKAPCCNLAESFSTNASVDVNYSDAVTGAREIMMLGLRGAYTQLLIEKRPMMTGLGSGFVMEYIPGTWLESIQISKGTGTVQNGYTAISGQLNTELVKPWLDKKLFINAYGSTFGRGELNIHLNQELSPKWSSGLLLHGSTRKNTLDDNNDLFYDTPQKTMFDGLWRGFYRGDLVRFQLNLHGLRDRHTAGQIPDSNRPGRNYTITQDNDRVDLFAKLGYLGFDNPNVTVGLITDVKWHKLESQYGMKRHFGTQRSGYFSGLLSHGMNGTGHKVDVGFSYTLDDYDEWLDDQFIGRRESVPGGFVEYTYTGANPAESGFKNKMGLVAGARIDHHNLFGWLFTPRLNFKYNFSEDRIFRFSTGRGYRTANVIAENSQVLASNRAILFLEDLDIESAWNTGINFTQNFSIAGRRGSIAFDAYHTRFGNQIIVDLESDYRLAQFYNLKGKTYATSLLGVLSYEIVKGLEGRIAYKYNDVKISFLDGPLQQKPMVAKHRGLLVLDYTTPNEQWELNFSTQLVGRQDFVHLRGNPLHNDEHHQGYAPAYTLLNAQVTHNFKSGLEIYTGIENIGGFRQPEPIIGAQNPFGEFFDAGHVYGPITGRMGYLGVRWSL